MHSFRTSLILLPLVIPSLVFADPQVAGGPRLRPYDERSAALFLDGLRRSETMRALVNQIEDSDLIVYLEMQPFLRARLAGQLTWITAAGRYRYLRVSLNPDLKPDVAIAVIGHELRHAVEVANEPSIVNDKSLRAFYERTGIDNAGHNGWDTEAARVAGEDVRRELSAARPTHTASAGPFDQAAWGAAYQRARDAAR